MASLRTNLSHLDETLESIQTKIEDQQFIIQALRSKSSKVEEEDDSELFNQYKDKYKQLYFKTEEDAEHWKNYKVYLQELLKKKKQEVFKKRPKIDTSLSLPIVEHDEEE